MDTSTFSAAVDRNSGLPLYLQIYEQLRSKIAQGEWRPGDALPPELELMERYQVSRATVRQAMDTLVRSGQVYRARGRGTFVAHPTVEQTLARVVSFTEDMRSRGFQPGTQVRSAGLTPATQDLAAKLGIEVGAELARIERLRLADGEPMSIEISHLVHSLCPGVLQHDYATQPLRQLLERDYGLRIVHATQAIRAINAPKEMAAALGLRRNAALLFIERVSFAQHELPIELLYLYHRGDRYVLYNELRG